VKRNGWRPPPQPTPPFRSIDPGLLSIAALPFAVHHGAAAANELGLTTQVPVREVYLTSGPTRKLEFGKQVVELRHAPAWQLALPKSPAGALIRALAWLGPEHASNAIEAVRGKLSESERNAIVELRRMLPTWMAQQVSKLMSNA
jgi:Family of unknown function (DUF6088)